MSGSPGFHCTACGAEWGQAGYGDACSKEALFDDQVVGLIEDGHCPACGESGVVEEVE